MTSRATIKDRVETYARSLLDAAKNENRGAIDLEQLRHSLKFSPEVLDLLARMESANDMNLREQVFKDLKEMLDSDDETVRVDVTTAVRMSPGLRAKVRDKCKADFNAPIYLVEHVDPKILGGIILEGHGNRRDASIRTQLATIRRTLSSSYMGGGTSD